MTAPLHRSHLIVIVSLLAGLWLFVPGIQGDFLFDDHINITENPSLKLPALRTDYLVEAATANPAGAGQRWLSMLSLALNQYWLGPEAYGFKLVNILLHGLNGLALYAFLAMLASLQATRQPIGRREMPLLLPAAGFMVSWWLLSPINLSPVLYVVQRMTSLSALFTWVCLTSWILFRRDLARGLNWGAVFWFMAAVTAALLSVSSKENGALIPLYLLLLDILLLRPLIDQPLHARVFAFLLGAIVLVCVFAITAFLLVRPDLITGDYGLRDFTPTERVMTQGRVLWFYAAQTLVPQNALLGLHQDDWVVSRGLLAPASTLLAWLGWTLITLAALRLRRHYPLASFGVLLFLAAHSMEASFLSLEMVHEHRNYLPSCGIIIAMTSIVTSLVSRFDTRIRRLISVGAALYLVAIAVTLSLRVNLWSNPVDHAMAESRHHPDSPRSQYQWGRVQLRLWEHTRDDAWIEGAHSTFRQIFDRFPENSDSLAGLLSISSIHPRYAPEAAHWREVFIDRLDDTRLHPSLVSQLPIFLESCAKAPGCLDGIGTVNQTFLTNPHASARFRALWLVRMAYFLSGAGMDARIEPLLRQAVAFAPSDKDVARILGIYYMQQGRFDEAEAVLLPLSKGWFGFTNPSIRYFLESIASLRSETDHSIPR